MSDFDYDGFLDGEDSLDDGFAVENYEGFSHFDPDLPQDHVEPDEEELCRTIKCRAARRKARRQAA